MSCRRLLRSVLRERSRPRLQLTVTSVVLLGFVACEGLSPPDGAPMTTLRVGIGMPVMRPWVVDDAVVARRIVTITLAADHRVSDGHRGALFLNAIDKFLQEPAKL